MTKEETIKLLTIIQTCFPNHYKNIEQRALKMTAEIWHRAFQDMDFNIVLNATQKYILQNKWPPTLAEIREAVIEITNPDALKTSQEAWEGVISAIKKYGYYQQPEAFKTFDSTTQRAVRAIGWQTICMSENIGIERANFCKFYDAMNKGEKEQAILPSAIYERIQELSRAKGIEAKNEL